MDKRESNSGKSLWENSRKLLADPPKPRAFRMTQREYRSEVSRAMREHVGERPGGAQVIADEIECSPKTAQSWLDGESTPQGLYDKRALFMIPTYRALTEEIAAMESDLDPRLQAKYHELNRLLLEIADGGGRI